MSACNDYVCMIMWLAECVCCDTPPKSGACCCCCSVEMRLHCAVRCLGNPLGDPHHNLRFLRHARKPVPVHIIMHTQPMAQRSTNSHVTCNAHNIALVKQVQTWRGRKLFAILCTSSSPSST